MKFSCYKIYAPFPSMTRVCSYSYSHLGSGYPTLNVAHKRFIALQGGWGLWRRNVHSKWKDEWMDDWINEHMSLWLWRRDSTVNTRNPRCVLTQGCYHNFSCHLLVTQKHKTERVFFPPVATSQAIHSLQALPVNTEELRIWFMGPQFMNGESHPEF